MAHRLPPGWRMKVLGFNVKLVFKSVEGRRTSGALLSSGRGAGSGRVLGGRRQGRFREWRRGVKTPLGRRLEDGVGERAGSWDGCVERLQGTAGGENAGIGCHLLHLSAGSLAA